MYVGRIVAVGLTVQKQVVAMYRVSSRSFPNRKIQIIGEAVAVVPKSGFESDIYSSPYIAYNCLRKNSQYVVVGNGTQADPVFEKLETGMSIRDSIISVLFGMDFEHDKLSTPRIVGVADKESKVFGLGVIRRDGIEVKTFELNAGQYVYISTYEHNSISLDQGENKFDVASANQACEFVHNQGLFFGLSNPISSVAAFESAEGFETAIFQCV